MDTNAPTTPSAELKTELNADLLSAIQSLADQEGRPVRAVIEEALADMLSKHRDVASRAEVWRHYEASLEQFGELYQRLAQ